MFRVPNDPVAPTFDDACSVSFWGWLRSGSAERREWRRRRDAAAQLARRNQNARWQR